MSGETNPANGPVYEGVVYKPVAEENVTLQQIGGDVGTIKTSVQNLETAAVQTKETLDALGSTALQIHNGVGGVKEAVTDTGRATVEAVANVGNKLDTNHTELTNTLTDHKDDLKEAIHAAASTVVDALRPPQRTAPAYDLDDAIDHFEASSRTRTAAVAGQKAKTAREAASAAGLPDPTVKPEPPPLPRPRGKLQNGLRWVYERLLPGGIFDRRGRGKGPGGERMYIYK
jgi:hypothetical protein